MCQLRRPQVVADKGQAALGTPREGLWVSIFTSPAWSQFGSVFTEHSGALQQLHRPTITYVIQGEICMPWLLSTLTQEHKACPPCQLPSWNTTTYKSHRTGIYPPPNLPSNPTFSSNQYSWGLRIQMMNSTFSTRPSFHSSAGIQALKLNLMRTVWLCDHLSSSAIQDSY